jgi:hypothetical protein
MTSLNKTLTKNITLTKNRTPKPISKTKGITSLNLLLITVMLLGIFYIINGTQKFTNFDIKSIVNGTIFQPLIPAIEFLETKSTENITIPIGLLAIIIIFIVFFFSKT